MCVVNKHTLLSREEYPKINGKRIHAIYARGIYEDGKPCDATEYHPVDHYLVCVDERKWVGSKMIDVPDFVIKELPEIFKPLFGEFEYKGKKYISRYFSIRTSDSCNGSFTDQTMDLGCGDYGHLNLYRAEPYMEKYENTIQLDSDLGKRMMATINSKSKVEELDWSYGVYFDQTWIRREGGLVYPDVALPSWRWLYGRPYVSNNYPSRDYIRVFHEEMNAHLYLESVKQPEVGMEGLIMVRFPDSWDKRPNEFCYLTTWSSGKEEDPNGIVRYKILAYHPKKKTYDIAAMIGDKVQFKENDRWGNGFYWINRISEIK